MQEEVRAPCPLCPAFWESVPAERVLRRQGSLGSADPKGLRNDFPERGSWSWKPARRWTEAREGIAPTGAASCGLGLIGDL